MSARMDDDGGLSCKKADRLELELEFFKLDRNAPEIVPAGSRRTWMDDTVNSFAYRCTPLIVANASGWEAIMPFEFSAEWSGGSSTTDIAFESSAVSERRDQVVSSHFGGGILTFKLGWLLRTSPGWATWVRGSPNIHKHGVVPLEGVVETEWLPFSFTMNWRFTEPGVVSFEKDEPFCFLTVVPHQDLDDVVPTECRLEDDLRLKSDHARWLNSRMDFMRRLSSGDPDARTEGWEKRYHRGDGAPVGTHIKKRKLHRIVKR